MKGIVLAGGKGTRLERLTKTINKHLLPVGDVPMIYHPLRKLIAAGIDDIAIVSGPQDLISIAAQLTGDTGHGKHLDADIHYVVQPEPGGIAQAVGLCEEFVNGQTCFVHLGDNIYEADLKEFTYLPEDHACAAIFMTREYQDCCVVTVDTGSGIMHLIEKPGDMGTPLMPVVAGIYRYPPDVFDIVRGTPPSVRGEIEITDVNLRYLTLARFCGAWPTGRWCDAGTIRGLYQASQIVFHKPSVRDTVCLEDKKRILELEAAIEYVVTQDADNLCWMDIYTKLAGLIGRKFDPATLPKAYMMRQCDRYTDSLQDGCPYGTDKTTQMIQEYRAIQRMVGALDSESLVTCLQDLLNSGDTKPMSD